MSSVLDSALGRVLDSVFSVHKKAITRKGNGFFV